MKSLALCVSFMLLSISCGEQNFLEQPSFLEEPAIDAVFKDYPKDAIHPQIQKVDTNKHIPAPDYYPKSLQGKFFRSDIPTPIPEEQRPKDKFHLGKHYPSYWDKEANDYSQKIEDNYHMMKNVLWNGAHLYDFRTNPGTEMTDKHTEYGRPAGTWLGRKTQAKWDEIMVLFKADGKRVWDDIMKCTDEMMDFSWTWNQQEVNEAFAMSNVCSAQNRDAIRDVYVNHQIDYYHNLFNVCKMPYEMELVDKIKPQAWAAVEELLKGPYEIMKGFSDQVQWIADAKTESDFATDAIRGPERHKEANRVNNGEKMMGIGRQKYHDTVRGMIKKIGDGAKERWMNEPAAQFYDEMENQIYEDFKQIELLSAKWWPQFCAKLFDWFLMPTEARFDFQNDMKALEDDKWP